MLRRSKDFRSIHRNKAIYTLEAAREICCVDTHSLVIVTSTVWTIRVIQKCYTPAVISGIVI